MRTRVYSSVDQTRNPERPRIPTLAEESNNMTIKFFHPKYGLQWGLDKRATKYWLYLGLIEISWKH